MTPQRRRIVVGTTAIAVLLAGYGAVHDYFEAAAFVVRAAGMKGAARSFADLEAESVTESEIAIPWRGGQLRGRRYLPSDVSGRPHPARARRSRGGIDEPRLINFAREIAATGHPVTTAELPDLTHYQITARTTDMIEDAATWLGQPDRARTGRRSTTRSDGDQLRRRALRGRRLAAWAIGRRGCSRSAVTATCRVPCDTCAPACSRTARPARRTTTAW